MNQFTPRNAQSKVAGDKPRKRGFSINQFAEYSDLGRDYLYKAIREGRLKARKAGRRTIILDDDGDAFLNSLPTL